MNKKWKLLAFLMTACMVITMIPMTAFADGDPAPGSFAALQALIDNVDAGGTVKLEQNYTFADTDKGPITIESGKEVTIDLNGHKIDRGLAEAVEAVQDGRIFTVSGTLTIQDTGTETGGKITGGFSSTDGGAILVGEGGVLNLESGEISGNRINNYRGNGGGAIQISKGTFNMSGGKISGNVCDRVYGGGGAVYSYYGTINMSGGEISGNTAKPFSNGGGGVYLNRSTMNMSGDAKIIDNYADGEGNIGRGGGVYLSVNSTFNMKGGKISDNRAALDGGGICVSNESTFNMSGGEISGNKALGKVPQWSLGLGGGIIASDATVIIEGGSIKKNEANQDGGGIYLRSYGGRVTTSLTMNDGEITDNTAGSYTPKDPEDEESEESATGSGGGVYLSNGVRFTMYGGEISENSSFGSAGGVMDAGSGSFELTGGSIVDNVAHGIGGGVFFNGNAFKLAGTVVINDNNGSVPVDKDGEFVVDPASVKDDNLCLIASTENTKSMEVGELNNDTEIHLWVYGNKYEEDPILINGSTMPLNEVQKRFKSDSPYYEIIIKEGNAVLALKKSTVEVSSWAELYLKLQDPLAAETVYTIVLKNYITPDTDNPREEDSKALEVPAGYDVVLDLNGQTIDRALKSAIEKGYVFRVEGSLMLKGEGIIKGGNCLYDGGGFYVANGGTLMINGENIQISENTSNYGAGVYVRGGLLAINHGKITGNTARENAGGVGVYGGGTFVSYEGKINSNHALDCSGVYVRDAGSRFMIMGGEVKDNESTNDGLAAAGIYIRSTNGFMVAGNPAIADNMSNINGDQTERNVVLDDRKFITMTPVQDALGKVNISVTTQTKPEKGKPVVFTSGLNGRNDASCFQSEEGYPVRIDANGEAVLLSEDGFGTVAFNKNGGSGTMKVQEIGLGMDNKLNANAFARDGYRFIGWNTQADGSGDAYDNRGVVNFTEDTTTLYAQWEKKSVVETKYTISIKEGPEHGTVKVSAAEAAERETVTVTVTPEEGYEPDNVIVTDDAGQPVELTDKGDGTYTFVMPASNVEVTAAFREAGDSHSAYDKCQKGESCTVYPFKDSDPKAWYHDGVHWALDEGIMKGMKEDQFGPNMTTSRGMIVTILYRLEGEPEAAEASFTDLTQEWYRAAVGWAAEKGIVNGMSAARFAPDDPITREQFAAIMYRYADYKDKISEEDKSTNLLDYDDVGEISDWAMEAMQWAVGAKLINGVTDTTLAPKGNATRAQAATILLRFCEE